MSDELLQKDLEVAEADMTLEEKWMFKKVKGLLGGLRGGTRQSLMTVNAIKNITKAIAYSKEAQKICMAIDAKTKTPEQFRAALKVADRGIALMDSAMLDFPATYNAISPVKTKIMEQRRQIVEIMKAEHNMVE